MRYLKCVGVGCWTFALLQLQPIFHHLSPLDKVIQDNSAWITCTTNRITIHIECGDEIIRCEEDLVEFHLCHIDRENVTFGFCGLWKIWSQKWTKCNKEFPYERRNLGSINFCHLLIHSIYVSSRRKLLRWNQSSRLWDTRRESSVDCRRIECDQMHRISPRSHRWIE